MAAFYQCVPQIVAEAFAVLLWETALLCAFSVMPLRVNVFSFYSSSGAPHAKENARVAFEVPWSFCERLGMCWGAFERLLSVLEDFGVFWNVLGAFLRVLSAFVVFRGACFRCGVFCEWLFWSMI